jgi:hypothetical protein
MLRELVKRNYTGGPKPALGAPNSALKRVLVQSAAV